MADCKGDVSLCACLPYILALTSLKDDDCGLIITEQVEKLVFELGSPQLDGNSGIETLEVTHVRVFPAYTGRVCSMVHSASCEGSTAKHAGINVELDRIAAILMNDESATHGGEEPVKPG